MILHDDVLARIVSGEIDVVFRRWVRPPVRAGGSLRTARGVLAIDAVLPIADGAVDERDATRAGYASLADLERELSQRQGQLYRIELRYAGPDPRLALRERAELAPEEVDELARSLAALERRRGQPWTRRVLELIGARPGVLAATLAKQLGQEPMAFKRDVRKLKELGLTESLEIGYRLSARGRAWLARQG